MRANDEYRWYYCRKWVILFCVENKLSDIGWQKNTNHKKRGNHYVSDSFNQ